MDCVGFEARGHGKDARGGAGHRAQPMMTVTRAGARLGIPGLYVTGDPGRRDANAKIGTLKVRIGLGWAKSALVHDRPVPGPEVQPPADDGILHDKVHIANAVNATVISLDDAPRGYKEFDKGAAKKYVLDPHNMIAAA